MIFIDWFKPAYKAGGPITSCANMIDLLKEDFYFYVLCGDRDYMESKPFQNVAFNEWIQYSPNCEVQYLSKERATKASLKRIADELEWDFIYINGIFSRVYSILPLSFVSDKKCILAPRGMLKPSALALRYFKKKLFLTGARISKTYAKIVFHATAKEEAQDIANQKLSMHIRVASNCPTMIKENKRIGKERNTLNICFPRKGSERKELAFRS